MGEINVTPKRMHQGGMILLALPACIPPPKPSLTETYDTTDKKTDLTTGELEKIALIQIGNGFSGEGDEDIRSSWDMRSTYLS